MRNKRMTALLLSIMLMVSSYPGMSAYAEEVNLPTETEQVGDDSAADADAGKGLKEIDIEKESESRETAVVKREEKDNQTVTQSTQAGSEERAVAVQDDQTSPITVYVDWMGGNDNNDGLSSAKPVYGAEKVLELIKNRPGSTILTQGGGLLITESCDISNVTIKRAPEDTRCSYSMVRVTSSKNTGEGEVNFENVIFDGENREAKAALLNVDSRLLTVNLKNGCILRNHRGSGFGSSALNIGLWEKEVNIEKGAVIENNYCTEEGGAISHYFGSLNIKGTVRNNTSGKDGGAYYAGSTNDVMVVYPGAEITGNQAKNGGAISVRAGIVQVSGGTITQNTATENGGAIYCAFGARNNLGNHTFTMNGGEIIGNTAGASGGAVYIAESLEEEGLGWTNFLGGKIQGNRDASGIQGICMATPTGREHIRVGRNPEIYDPILLRDDKYTDVKIQVIEELRNTVPISFTDTTWTHKRTVILFQDDDGKDIKPDLSRFSDYYDEDKDDSHLIGLYGQEVKSLRTVLPEYEFVSGTAGQELPEELKSPELTETRTLSNDVYKNGRVMVEDTVYPSDPKKTTVTANGGRWTFKGYDKSEEVVTAAGVKFTGTWERTALPTNAWVTEPKIADQTYRELSLTPEGESQFGKDNLKFTYSGRKEGPYTDTLPEESPVGTYYMKAEVADGDNYAGISQIVEFQILQKDGRQLNIGQIDSKKDLENLTIEHRGYTLVEGTDYDLKTTRTVNKEKTGATVTVDIVFKGNYRESVQRSYEEAVYGIEYQYQLVSRAELPEELKALLPTDDKEYEEQVTESYLESHAEVKDRINGELEKIKGKTVTTEDATYVIDGTYTLDTETKKAQNRTIILLNVTVTARENEAPVISAADKELNVGDTFDVRAGVTATDKEDEDLTDKIEIVTNTVDTSKAGTYEVTYQVTDTAGATATKTIKVVVKAKASDGSKDDPKEDPKDTPKTDTDPAKKETTTVETKVITTATKTPRTGDASNAGLAFLGLAVGVMGVLEALRRKKI